MIELKRKELAEKKALSEQKLLEMGQAEDDPEDDILSIALSHLDDIILDEEDPDVI